MKPILHVVTEDRKLQSTLNTLFEDLYKRALPDDILKLFTQKIETPHIEEVVGGAELNYTYLYARCQNITNAKLYCWAFRPYGTAVWMEMFSSSYSVKIPNLFPDTEYQVRVKAYGIYLFDSDWSQTVFAKTPDVTPSKVTGVTVTNEALYVDPTTGVTLASVKVEWNNNADSELVDAYEVIWYP